MTDTTTSNANWTLPTLVKDLQKYSTFGECKERIQALLKNNEIKSLTSSDERLGFLLANLDEDALLETLGEDTYPSAFNVAFKKGIITGLDFDTWMKVQTDDDRFKPQVASVRSSIIQHRVSRDRDKPTDKTNSELQNYVESKRISLNSEQQREWEDIFEASNKGVVNPKKQYQDNIHKWLESVGASLDGLNELKLTIKTLESKKKSTPTLNKGDFLICFNNSDNTSDILFDIRRDSTTKTIISTFNQQKSDILCFQIKKKCNFGRKTKYNGNMYYLLFKSPKKKSNK